MPDMPTDLPDKSTMEDEYDMCDKNEAGNAAFGEAFDLEKHCRFLLSSLDRLPRPYVSLDTNRLSAVYFCIVGLDILGKLHLVDKCRIIEYIYSMQLYSSVGHHVGSSTAPDYRVADNFGSSCGCSGFMGSS
jgi:hypothetical protein